MALAALHVWRRPLPEVLREEIMEPIGASSTWRWFGYDNAWVEIDGQKMQAVGGGGHWGGGMFINAYDMARFGYLFLRNGKWKDRQLVPEKWIQMARTPGPANANYGYANWFLNTGRKPLPSAPESASLPVGNGANIIYIDWENDIVAVVRWIRRRRRAQRVRRQADRIDQGQGSDHGAAVTKQGRSKKSEASNLVHRHAYLLSVRMWLPHRHESAHPVADQGLQPAAPSRRPVLWRTRRMWTRGTSAAPGPASPARTRRRGRAAPARPSALAMNEIAERQRPA